MGFTTRAFGVLVLGVSACAAGAAQADQTPAAPIPPCVAAVVAVDETLDSAKAHGGDPFRFKITDPVTAPDGTAIPSGTTGYGVIANATQAGKGGTPGYLALETRFAVLANGKHVPVIIDRSNDDSSVATGSRANAPSMLGLIPFVGYAVGGYDSLHHGRNAAILTGTRVAVYIGDDAALGTCRRRAAGESPVPSASPAPAVSASAAPSPSASPA